MLNIQFTFGNWLATLFILASLYLAMQFLDNRLEKVNFFGKYQNRIHKNLKLTLLIFEPFVVLILLVSLVFINPLVHGLGFLVFLLFCYNHMRNYLNGRIARFDQNIRIGAHLSVGEVSGIISGIGRLDLCLRNAKGLHVVNYSTLLSDGYLVHAGDQVGGYYRLKIFPKETNNKVAPEEKIMDILVSAPYLDWMHKPEFYYSEKKVGQLNAHVSVKDEDHLYDLIALIDEWGYNTKILKNK